MSELPLDAAGRRRSPATLPQFHAGRPPRNKGMVAVGTALRFAGSGGPPRRSQRALLTHWAPGLGTSVESRVGPGMCDLGWREPPLHKAVHPLPIQASALAAAP
jgi:hypothetical protein